VSPCDTNSADTFSAESSAANSEFAHLRPTRALGSIANVNRVALVTGCSSGFGLETTVSLARRGWKVYASMRDPTRRDPLDQRLDKIEAETGVAGGASKRVEVIQLDVTSTESVQAALKLLMAGAGRLDALVNNAGVSGGGAAEDQPMEEVRRIFETNFFAVVEVTKAFLPILRQQRSGQIVIVSSAGAFFGSPGLSAYSASKWAVEGWAEALAIEVAPFGIGVSCVEPGSYRTNIWESSPRSVPADSPYSEFAEAVERFVDSKIVPRARDPREVGEAIAKVLESRSPRFRNPVGPDSVAQHVARGKVPNRLYRVALTKAIGI